jgi:hypothetical protein
MTKFLITITLLVGFICHVEGKTSAVVEMWKTHLYIPAPDDLTIKEFKRIRIIDETGYRFAIYHDYYNTFKKIRSLHYTIFDANNKKVKRLSRMDALDIMLNSSYETADARSLYLDPQYRNFPFTIEIEVESSYNGFIGFPLWMPRFTHDLEIIESEMTLECYLAFKFKASELNGVQPPSTYKDAKVQTVKWSLRNLPAIEEHISHKAFVAEQPKVHLTPLSFSLENTSGSFHDWASFGEWYRVLNEGRNLITADTKAFLDGVRKEYGNNTALISKIVYQFMQSKTRYISIQLGIGGYQTIPSDEVERTGYGDCKALTNYMGAMLGYLNIPSNHVLVQAGADAPEILHNFPSNQFNHVFLAVPLKSDTLWFECTSQTLPPGYIGTFTDDRFVLWVDKGTSKIIRTPAYSADESVRKTKGEVRIQPQGDAELQLKVTQEGMFYDEAMYYQNLPEDRIQQFNYSKFYYKDFSIKSFKYTIPDKNEAVLNVDITLKVNILAKAFGPKMLIPANVLQPLEKSFEMDLLNKKTEIRRAFTLEDEIHIMLPENYRIAIKPADVKDSSEFGTFEMRFEPDDKNGLRVFRKVVINKGYYSKERFDRFYQALKKIRDIEQSKIILQSKT